MLDYRRFKDICELFACGKVDQARRLLMEMQSRCLALRDEIAMLKMRLTELEGLLNLAENMYCEHGFYWLSSHGLRQGPFCPRCYEADGALIRLERKSGFLYCPYCSESFEKELSHCQGAGSAKILVFDRSVNKIV